MKTALAACSGILLAVTFVMPSDARPHNDRLSPRRFDATSFVPAYSGDFARRDNSCLNAPGLPDMYACSSN